MINCSYPKKCLCPFTTSIRCYDVLDYCTRTRPPKVREYVCNHFLDDIEKTLCSEKSLSGKSNMQRSYILEDMGTVFESERNLKEYAMDRPDKLILGIFEAIKNNSDMKVSHEDELMTRFERLLKEWQPVFQRFLSREANP
jgi:hypothetical protein